ncbi:MAG: glycosyltransferase family 39 protein [Candidatus Omnitrophica bacterium]|nr:glycosyltransferase family 39 protein [Candidatus Omnitrophota bacterium]
MSRGRRRVVFIFMLLILALNLSSMRNNSITIDEKAFHREFGRRILDRTAFLTGAGTMPVTALNVLPVYILDRLGMDIPERGELFIGRLVTVFCSMLLGLLVFLWANDLYGFKAAVFSLGLYAFSPNILAHSQLITTDIYSACFIFTSLYLFVKYLKRPSMPGLIMSAAATAPALLAKNTALFLPPIFGIILLSSGYLRSLKNRRSILLKGIVYASIIILLINAGYLFKDSFMPLGSFQFQSWMLNKVKSCAADIIVPLPRLYLETIDLGKFYNDTCSGHPTPYLLGRLSDSGCGWPYYFIAALLFKLPLAIIILLILGAAVLIKDGSTDNFDKISVGAPPLLFLAFFFPFFNNQAGIRNALILFPFFYLIIAKIISYRPLMRHGIFRVFLLSMVMWYLISALSFHPHYLSYFNELIGRRENMYKYLADSNVDWGQNKYYLRGYLDKHKGLNAIVNPEQPSEGIIIVNINSLVGITQDPQKYRWLRENYEPVGHIAYSWLIYDTAAGNNKVGHAEVLPGG